MKFTFVAVVVCTMTFAAFAAAQSSDLPGDDKITGSMLVDALTEKLDADLSEKLETGNEYGGGTNASTSAALVEIRQKLRLRHTNKEKWPQWMKDIGNSVSGAFKKLGGVFQDLYNNFKKMFGSAFKMPRLAIGNTISTSFKKAVASVKGKFKMLGDIAKKHTKKLGGEEMMLEMAEMDAKDRQQRLGGI
jgi:hypothetical protein